MSRAFGSTLFPNLPESGNIYTPTPYEGRRQPSFGLPAEGHAPAAAANCSARRYELHHLEQIGEDWHRWPYFEPSSKDAIGSRPGAQKWLANVRGGKKETNRGEQSRLSSNFQLHSKARIPATLCARFSHPSGATGRKKPEQSPNNDGVRQDLGFSTGARQKGSVKCDAAMLAVLGGADDANWPYFHKL